jgi:hypothetical protein
VEPRPERQYLTGYPAGPQPFQDGGHDSFLTADDRLVGAVVVRDHNPVQTTNGLSGPRSPAAKCGEHQPWDVQRRRVE